MNGSIKIIEQAAGSDIARSPLDPAPLEQMYQGKLDVLILRGLFPSPAVSRFADNLAAINVDSDWNRPNIPVPGIDLRLLGVGAAPTATTPAGPDADAYFATASITTKLVARMFGEQIDPFALIETGLQQSAGVRALVPSTPKQDSFSPCTVRAMPEGQGLMLHHDNHFGLSIYDDLREQLDTSLLASYFVQLQSPDSGGRLCVYAMGPEEDGGMPRMEHNMLDPVAFHQQVPHEYLDLANGDMILFGSSRLYHKVEPVSGDRPRVTMGGFVGLSSDHQRCFYWS